MIVARVAVAVVGAVLVLWTLLSAVRTVVVPRAIPSTLTRVHFRALRVVFDVLAPPRSSFEHRDRMMAFYAPIGLVLLPGIWVLLIIIGFTGIFWGTGVDPLSEAFATSGSSMLTLGFIRSEGTWRVAIEFIEAGLGLAVVSLMISYLPTIYGAFSRREVLIGRLEARAGLPPSASELFRRFHRIGWLDEIDELFEEWEVWFADIEESHSSQSALVFFRSLHSGRSWITSAGCMLDSAALRISLLDRPFNPSGAVMMRTGFFSLRRIADFFALPYDPDPAPDAPISVTRADFDQLCVELEEAGLALKPDRDQAWRDFAGWRVNYDSVLLQLCALVMAPPAPWSSDRMPTRPRIRFRPTKRDRVASPSIR
ncbi:MAG: hypothetical protein ACOYL9_00625 [Ilumatobacteraceae bacterium]